LLDIFEPFGDPTISTMPVPEKIPYRVHAQLVAVLERSAEAAKCELARLTLADMLQASATDSSTGSHSAAEKKGPTPHIHTMDGGKV
jgi:hypothetical protein